MHGIGSKLVYDIYINIDKLITLLILSFKTWKCAQIDKHPSKYFGTKYQSLKMCLKNLWKNSKSRQLWHRYSGRVLAQCLVSLTDKTMSDQVDKTTFEQQITRRSGLAVNVSSDKDNREILGSIPEKVIFFEFSNFDSFDVFMCSGTYIHTFQMK